MMTNNLAATFREPWLIYDFPLPADNPTIRIDAKYDTQNVQVKDGELKMKQLAFKSGDKHISISGIQSHKLDIGHGTFRTVFNVRGADGGSCASFFWYRVCSFPKMSNQIILTGGPCHRMTLLKLTLRWSRKATHS